MNDKGLILVEILPDGRIKIDTGDLSGPSHRAADEFLQTIERVCGGSVERKKKPRHVHHHAHEHGHTHEH